MSTLSTLGARAARLATCLLVLGVVLAARNSFAAGRGFVIDKRPAWVDARSPDLDYQPDSPRFGAATVLEDRQRRFTRDTSTVYVHDATKVTATSGIAAQSELRVQFDPSFQSLHLHAVRVLRNRQAINVLRADDIKVIQRETSLSDGIYDGKLTALLFLRDVRVGDVVEYEYSIVGRHPAFADHIDMSFDLARRLPIHALRHRVLAPSGVPLFMKTLALTLPPVISEHASEREYVWERADVPAVIFEDNVPGWYDEAPWVQLTDFRSWGDVAEWAAGLFDADLPASAELTAQIERVRSASANDEGRVLAALRFVQDDVRYVGIELGKGGYEPRAPSEVLATRFGDCKDKAFLLVTILRALGIDAAPALVSTATRRGLDEVLPSAWFFDHAIARVRLGGRTFWLDGTETYARGPLEERTPNFERALVAERGERALSTIAPFVAATPAIAVEETYDAAGEGPTPLRVRTVYRRQEADAMRRALARTPREELTKRRLDARVVDAPGITSTGTLEVADDETSNVVTVSETFRLPDVWRDGAHTFSAPTLGSYLTIPDAATREVPLSVDFPVDIEVASTVVGSSDALDEHERIATSALVLEYTAKQEGGRVRRAFHLRTLRDAVLPREFAAHADGVRQMRRRLDLDLERTDAIAKSDRPISAAAWLAPVFGFVIFGVVVSGIAWLGAWLGGQPPGFRALDFKRRAMLAAGDAPATALAFATREASERWLSSVQCRCGRRAAVHPRGEVHYGGATVCAASVVCACGHEDRRYFRIGS